MQFTGYSFGSVRVDGVTYGHDLIIDRGKVRKRKKAASRKFRGAYGHTPLSAEEDIPWRCRRLVIGTGADGALPLAARLRPRQPPRRPVLAARHRHNRGRPHPPHRPIPTRRRIPRHPARLHVRAATR